MEVKASLKFVRVGAQKTRPVANMVRGKDVNEAIRSLTFLEKKSARIIKKLLESAVANANEKKVVDVDNLFIKSITVDAGPHYHRFIPRAQGRATGVKKRTSHINLVLDER